MQYMIYSKSKAQEKDFPLGDVFYHEKETELHISTTN